MIVRLRTLRLEPLAIDRCRGRTSIGLVSRSRERTRNTCTDGVRVEVSSIGSRSSRWPILRFMSRDSGVSRTQRGAVVPISDSTAVLPLTSYVSGSGDLTIGLESILILVDQSGSGASLHLPSSLHLSVTLTPVPVPEPSTLGLLALGLTSIVGQACRRARTRSFAASA